MRCLVTGASGFVGGHVTEALLAAGHSVRTVVRPSSKLESLREWGVELVEGDLTDSSTLQRAAEGVDAVVHCAAKVGDWGPAAEYQQVNVAALAKLFDSCKGKPLERFVLVSSLGVYAARDHFGTDETEPLPERHIDAYTQSKADADRLALRYQAEHGTPLVILRPGFVYGPRDRTVLPTILENLRRGIVTYFGSRQKKLNQVYVGNIADACVAALTRPNVIGRIYNLTDERLTSKEEFFGSIADLVHLPRPTRTIPLPMARLLCGAMGVAGKTFGFQPPLTNAKLKFMGLNLEYSVARARAELDYQPKVGFAEGIRRAVEWHQANHQA